MVQDFTNVHDAPVQIVNSEGSGRKKMPFMALSLLSALPPVLFSLMLCLLFAATMTTEALAVTATVSSATAFGLSLVGRLVPAVRENIGVILPVAIVACFVLIMAVPDARFGLFSLCNALIDHFDDAFSFYVALLPVGGLVSGSLSFGVFFGVLVGLTSWSVTRQPKPGVSLLFVVVMCGVSLFLSLGYELEGVVLGLCTWIMMCRFIQLRTSSYSTWSLLLDVFLFFVGTLVAVAALAWAYSPAAVVDNVREGVLSAFDEVCYGHDSLPEGDLAKAPSMNTIVEEDHGLNVTVEKAPSDDLLLKGFVGAKLDGTKWSALNHESYEGGWRGLFGWLSRQGLVPAEQRSAYDDAQQAAGRGVTGSLVVNVDASTANRRYVYAPYTMSNLNGASAQLDLDGSILGGPFGARTYRIDMDDVPTASVLSDTSWLANSQSSYAQAESVYSAFAKEGYLDIDDENEKAVEKLIFNEKGWDKKATTSKQAVVSRVRTMLETLASYTESPKYPSQDKPFAEWFLSDAREGNSAYFATVATLAFRSQGIPARYVEGYRASTDQMSGAASVGSTMLLEASEAHAWTEIYLDGQGWTPIEVTPGFYVQNSKADKVVDVKKAVSRGTDNSMTESGSVMGDVDDESDQGPQAPSLGQVIAGFGGIAVLAFVLLLVLLFVQRGARILLSKGRSASEDQNIAVPALYRYLTRVMKEAGCSFDPLRPLDCMDAVPVALPGIAAEEYRRAIELHECFAFGGRDLKPHEMRAIRTFASRIHNALPECTSTKAKIKRYFISAL